MPAIPKVRITAHEISRELRKNLEKDRNGDARKWAVFEELRLGTGFSTTRWVRDPEERDARESRIDLFAINAWPSSGYERRAYEIKVDRQDLRNELANPGKRAPWLEIVNAFYFVLPRELGIRSLDMIREQAPECGVIYYSQKVKPDPSICDCGDLKLTEDLQAWRHSFGCAFKDAYKHYQSGRMFNTARAPMKLPGCDPSWGLVASILRSAARA